MASIKEVKKKVLDDIVDLLDTLDPSGDSGKIYKDKFGKMSDKEFVEYMDWWIQEERNDRLRISTIEFEHNIDVDNIVKAAELINVPLYEYVACPDINGSSEDAVVCTPEPVAVGYIQPKRMPQTVFKKTTGSISDAKRNPKTGQVTGDDKNARNSDVETYSLISIGAEKALREFMGPRGDDTNASSQMHQQITANGYFSLDKVDTDRSKKTAINTLDVHFHMQGFMTNMIYPPDVIPSGEKFQK